MASAALFGAVVQAFALVGAAVKDLYDQDAADQPRTGRDVYMSATYGHLHEASMSDFLDLLTECTAYLQALTDLLHALETVHTDRLLVRGMDQLFSFDESLASLKNATISGADGYSDSATPPAGSIWRITSIGSNDINSPNTARKYRYFRTPTSYTILDDVRAFAAAEWAHIQRDLWLHPGDVIRVYYTGGLAGDSCRIDLLGYIMTLET